VPDPAQFRIPAITPKVLTQRLRQVERDGLVVRTYHPEIPPRVAPREPAQSRRDPGIQPG
jgi:HxlR-like helix-turn-helix